MKSILERLKNFKNVVAKRIANIVSLNSEKFLSSIGLKGHRRKVTSEATYSICLKMLSETLAKMPLKHYQKTENGVSEMPTTEEQRILCERPNPYMTATMFWAALEMNRNHFGNGYAYLRRKLVREKYGGEIQLIDAWIMRSDCVQIVIDDAGYFGGKGRLWYVYRDPIDGSQYVLANEDVLHVKTSHSFDGITGLPVQVILRSLVDGASASQEFMNNMYESGLTARAVLEYTGEMGRDAKEKMVEVFKQFGSGASNAGSIIPVPAGMKLTPMNIKMTDAQFFELKKYNSLQIAAAFGIKPNQINDYEKSSYSNSEMQQLSFYVDTESFVLKQYEEEINYKVLTDKRREGGEFYKFNEKVLLRTDSKTQMEILTAGVKNSIYGPNEARRKLDLQDKEGGDELYANGNLIPLKMAGVQYTTKE